MKTTLDGPFMLLRAFGIWCAFVVIAVVNGAVRETVIAPRLGAVRGGQGSAILLALLILLLTYLSIRWVAPRDARDAWLVGTFWLILILVFEFGLGRVQGTPWSVMLEEYRFWAGKLWVLVLLSATTAPFLTGRLRQLI